jgi:hypothetical protein
MSNCGRANYPPGKATFTSPIGSERLSSTYVFLRGHGDLVDIILPNTPQTAFSSQTWNNISKPAQRGIQHSPIWPKTNLGLIALMGEIYLP